MQKPRFEHMLKNGEMWIKGEEKFRRLKESPFIRLDARILETLWENKHLIPETWKRKTSGDTTFIFFDGTILQSSSGARFVLYLGWRYGQWDWRCRWLEDDWRARHPSAVVAS
ncbi:MAG: hypothetical protein ABSG35_14300 [Syntrophobacteraceae bacterium]